MMDEKYVFGYSDLGGVWRPYISFTDRVEYVAMTTNWLPPRYKVVKLVNGGVAETLVEGVSSEVAKGYIKLLGK
jgi:hypothetical protein